MKVLTNLDDKCECGRSSRCHIHNDSMFKKTEIQIITRFYVCERHYDGLELETTGFEVYPASSFIKSYQCNVANCNRDAYAAFFANLKASFSQEK